MNVTDFLPLYPDTTQSDFYEILFRKKELYDLRLGPSSDKIGPLLKQQVYISRLISPHTNYRSILIFHGLGTGKTTTSITIGELFRNQALFPHKKVLILVGNDKLVEVFKKEIQERTQNPLYELTPEQMSSEHRYKTNLTKKININYEIATRESFSNSISELGDNDLRERYSKRVIIIDEAHNLHIQTQKKKKKIRNVSIYKTIHRLLRLVENTRTILLTGTPMVNEPYEIASLMNLILPKTKKIPFGSGGNKFDERFFDKEGNLKNIEQLKASMKGHISYLRPKLYAQRIDEGQIIRPLTRIKVVPSKMSNHQKRGYLRAKDIDDQKTGNLDSDEQKHAFSLNSRYASDFVYEDGTFGTEKDRKGHMISTIKKGVIDSIKGKNIEKKLKSLGKYSSKYETIIRSILKGYERGELCFVYGKFVSGSGLILFARLLKLFGYNESNGTEKTEGKRYVLVTGKTNPSRLAKIRKLYNTPENKTGKFIQVFIGSETVGEGISLFNTRQVHIVNPHWNNSVTEQAIGRVFRTFSHEIFEKEEDRYVKVFRHATILDDEETIDIKLYKLSEDKDRKIKKIERVLKEIAIDCPINYERNVRSSDIDDSIECDYMKCTYQCDGISPIYKEEGRYVANNLITDTFNLYYSEPIVRNIMKKIIKLFREDYIIPFQRIVDRVRFNDKLVLNALGHIINKNIKIRNRIGFFSYLREENDTYFLVADISTSNDPLTSYYSKFQNTDHKYDFSTILQIQNMENKDLDRLIYTDVFLESAEQKIGNIIKNLSIDIKQILLEQAIEGDFISREDPIKDKRREIIRNYFEHHIYDVHIGSKDTIIHSVGDKLRCFDKKDLMWVVCDPQRDYEMVIERKQQSDINEIVKGNKYELYGIISDDKFRIRDVSINSKGKVCNTYDKQSLIDFLTRLNVKPPKISDITDRNILITHIRKKLKGKGKVNDKSIYELQIMAGWVDTKLSNELLCETIQKILSKKKLIIYQ